MSIATATRPLQTPRYCWFVPATVPFAQGWRYTLFCPLLGLHGVWFQQATDLEKGLRIPSTGGSADPRPKTQIQIPIALLPDLDSVPHPAVSCLEAS